MTNFCQTNFHHASLSPSPFLSPSLFSLPSRLHYAHPSLPLIPSLVSSFFWSGATLLSLHWVFQRLMALVHFCWINWSLNEFCWQGNSSCVWPDSDWVLGRGGGGGGVGECVRVCVCVCVCVMEGLKRCGEPVRGGGGWWLWPPTFLSPLFASSPLLELQQPWMLLLRRLTKTAPTQTNQPPHQAELLSDRRPSLSLKRACGSVLPHFTHFGLLYTLPPQPQIPPQPLMWAPSLAPQLLIPFGEWHNQVARHI